MKARDWYSTMLFEVSDANVSSQSTEDDIFFVYRASAIKGRCAGLCVARAGCLTL